MKKLLFGFSASLFLIVSCSESSDVVLSNDKIQENFQTKSGDTLSRLKDSFIIMMNSENYVKAESLALNFFDKMNTNGDISMLSDYDTMIQWIDTNIAKTLFTSKFEAETEYANYISTINIVKAENSFFFTEISNTTVEEQEIIINAYLDNYLLTNPDYNVTYSETDPRTACVRALRRCHFGVVGAWVATTAYNSNFTPMASFTIQVNFRNCGNEFRECMRNADAQ